MNEADRYRPDFPWKMLPDAMVDLRTLYAAGVSYGKIARDLQEKYGGVLTRSSIGGRLHRMGLTNKRPPKPKVERRAPLSQRRLRIHTGGGRAFRGEVEIVPDVDLVDLPPDQSDFACTIMELTGGMCRWPMGEPTADMRYCGAACVGSWCARHRLLVWNSPGRHT